MAIYAAEDSKTFRFNYRYRMSTNKIRKSKIDNISLLIYARCSDFDKEKKKLCHEVSIVDKKFADSS